MQYAIQEVAVAITGSIAHTDLSRISLLNSLAN